MRNPLSLTLRASAFGLALMWVTVGGSPAHAESPTPGCYQMERVFDPGLPPGEAADEMAWLRSTAERGGKHAAYFLGTLYRLGPSHPARRLPRDPEQARHWLTQSALAGELGAMAGLVELELSLDRPREALVLAKVRAYYARKFPDAWMANVGNYSRFLVQRAEVAMLRKPASEREVDIQADVEAYIARHGQGIEARINKGEKKRADARCAPYYDYERWPLVRRGTRIVPVAVERTVSDEPAFAWVMPMVNAKGRVEKVHVVDYAATLDELRVLRGLALSQRYNRMPDAPMRSALLPMNLY